jgi:hypothetical protein
MSIIIPLFHVVPTPNISILASDGVLYAEVGTSLELICSISVDPAIADNVTVSVTWFQGETPLFYTTDNVSITYSNPDSLSPFISILTLYSINTTDSDNFTCIAGVVPDDQLQLFTDSDLAEETVVVIVEGKQFSKLYCTCSIPGCHSIVFCTH